jgi:hypothetical protein
MSLYFYKGAGFIKNYIIHWLDSIFLAEQKGEIHFYDGTKKFTPSRRPRVVGSSSWDQREIPAVLIDAASGRFKYMSISKDVVDAPAEGSTDTTTTYNYYGGDIEVNVGISIIARTKPEREDLLDIVGIYLSHPDAKDWFMQHNIILPEGPSFGGETEIRVPPVDFPLYKTTMSWKLVGMWQDRQAADEGLIDVIARINPYTEIEITGRVDLDLD